MFSTNFKTLCGEAYTIFQFNETLYLSHHDQVFLSSRRFRGFFMQFDHFFTLEHSTLYGNSINIDELNKKIFYF